MPARAILRQLFLTIAMVSMSLAAAEPGTPYQPNQELNYLEGQPFPGKVGRTPDDSVPAWPVRARAPDAAPNVLIWLLDDAGFAHLSAYGGQIETPTVQRLAERGLTFTNFHSVPLCSPARAALLSGRNHHSVAMGSHVMSPAGYPGYNSRIPDSAGSLAAVLKEAGYATFALGKWDQTPVVEAGPSGPYDSWPSGQGFDHFYGFLGGEANHFFPNLWRDHSPVTPQEGEPDYFLTTDLADQAKAYLGSLKATRPGTPFFMYWATGAVHAPHHAPKEYIEDYRGRFSEGWDRAREKILSRQLDAGVAPPGTRLAPEPPLIPAWDTLTEREQAFYARQMEAFAAQLTHADEQFGRILAFLEEQGDLENTIVIVTSDNGASGEGGLHGLHNEALSFNSQARDFEAHYRFMEDWGGPKTTNHFHAGWGMAGNTPFPFYKHHSDLGGTRVPMILSWPAGLPQRGLRNQYHHIIDLMPTVLDLVSVSEPNVLAGVPQQPVEGVPMSYAIRMPQAPSRRTRQYYEIWGNRAIYDEGWLAVTIHNDIMPWQVPNTAAPEDDEWRLYDLKADFSASEDLAAERPGKLAELRALWWQEAEEYGVFPLDPNRRARFIAAMNKSGPKDSVIRYPGIGVHHLPETLSPPVKRRSHEFSVELAAPFAGEEGVLVAAGGKTGGYVLYLKGGHLNYAYNLYNEKIFTVRSAQPVPDGAKQFRLRFDKDAEGLSGVASLHIDNDAVGSVRLTNTTVNSFSIEDPFDIGMDSGSPVVPAYSPPFRFGGEIDEVVFLVDEQ